MTRKRITRKDIGLLAAMTAVGLLGLALYLTDGVSDRVPKEVLAFSIDGAETSKFWRRGECLLLPEQGAAAFKEDCMARGQHPRILVWGDSYAAAIAMGFKQLEEKHHFSVGWLSSSSCPPFMGFTMVLRPFCKENNDWIMDAIRKAPPDIVILHSTWSYDPGDIRRGFASTVSELRAVGIKKIIVMGPVATWNGAGLPTGFIEYSMRGSRSLMPKYSFFNSNYNANKATEALLQEQAALHGLTYVSPLSMMCNGQGCMARIGEHDEQLTSFDTGHVTVPTATFLVQALLPQILQ